MGLQDFGSLVVATASTFARTLAARFADSINVKDFGARGDGATDDTAAIQAAINALPSVGGQVFFPNGKFLVTSQITVTKDRTHLVGCGEHATRIDFQPTTDSECFHFEAPASAVLYQCSIRGMAFYSTDSTYRKTAIRVVDHSGFRAENISISGSINIGSASGWSGGTGGPGGIGVGSIGIQLNGREAGVFDNIRITGDRCLVIGTNPNSTLSIDTHNFQNLYLTGGQSGTRYPLIEVLDGVNISGVTFGGYQAWVGGSYGFYFLDTSSTVVHQDLRFQNLRTEQGADATKHSIYISCKTGNALYNLHLFNVCLSNARPGIYWRNINSIKIENFIGLMSAKNVFDGVADTAGEVLELSNCYTAAATLVSLTGYRLMRGGYQSSAPVPVNAQYHYSAASFFDASRSGGSTYEYTTDGSLASGANVVIPGSNTGDGLTCALMFVATAGATKSTVSTLVLSGLAFDGTVSANAAIGNTAGKISFLKSSGKLQILNNTGETQSYVVRSIATRL